MGIATQEFTTRLNAAMTVETVLTFSSNIQTAQWITQNIYLMATAITMACIILPSVISMVGTVWPSTRNIQTVRRHMKVYLEMAIALHLQTLLNADMTGVIVLHSTTCILTVQ